MRIDEFLCVCVHFLLVVCVSLLQVASQLVCGEISNQFGLSEHNTSSRRVGQFGDVIVAAAAFWSHIVVVTQTLTLATRRASEQTGASSNI
jgi:hypothetical protein